MVCKDKVNPVPRLLHCVLCYCSPLPAVPNYTDRLPVITGIIAMCTGIAFVYAYVPSPACVGCFLETCPLFAGDALVPCKRCVRFLCAFPFAFLFFYASLLDPCNFFLHIIIILSIRRTACTSPVHTVWSGSYISFGLVRT